MEDRGHRGSWEEASYCGNSVFFPAKKKKKKCQPSCLVSLCLGAQSHCSYSKENTDPFGIFGSKEIAGKHCLPLASTSE